MRRTATSARTTSSATAGQDAGVERTAFDAPPPMPAKRRRDSRSSDGSAAAATSITEALVQADHRTRDGGTRKASSRSRSRDALVESRTGTLRRFQLTHYPASPRRIAESSMKVSIIGGGGLVGSCTGVCAAMRRRRPRDRPARRQRRPGGRARRSTCCTAGRAWPIRSSRRAATSTFPTSDVICITAGLRRKPDESRLDLINRNIDLFLGILDEISKAGVQEGRDRRRRLEPGRRAHVRRGRAARACRPAQVIGLGTQLDTIRFRSLIAAEARTPRRRRSRP